MRFIGQSRQVLCITHLAQIAAMANTHYLIQKSAEDNSTHTSICQLDEDASIRELARLLGGATITDNILQSAKDMKRSVSSK